MVFIIFRMLRMFAPLPKAAKRPEQGERAQTGKHAGKVQKHIGHLRPSAIYKQLVQFVTGGIEKTAHSCDDTQRFWSASVKEKQ